VLHNGLGRYDSAFAPAQRACEHDDLGLFGWALIKLVEAGVRTGKPDTAAAAFWQLDQRTPASGTGWALGIAAGSRALLSHGQAADTRYREAIERLASSRITVHLARARLLYGEWLRRERRRGEAREQLRTVRDMFSCIGAEGFAERAGHELPLPARPPQARRRSRESGADRPGGPDRAAGTRRAVRS
jgi:hypothetical protein